MKKIVITALLVLCLVHVVFIDVSIAYEGATQVERTTSIITVDDEGDGDYTSIKDALMHAVDGDIIEVYSGTYQEHNIIINTSNLTLKGVPSELGVGDDAGKPFIDGQGIRDVIDVLSLSVTITGFHIENRGENTAQHIIGIDWDAHNCNISDNDLHYTIGACITCGSDNNMFLNNNISHSTIRVGIGIAGNNNTIVGNRITDIDLEGIEVRVSNNNTIINNFISRCYRGGIHANGNYNLIKYNTISESPWGIDTGSDYNQIIQNNFFENNRHVFLTAPIENILIDGNYWGRSRFLPKPVFGWRDLSPPFFDIPWLFFDWHPALRPYVI